MLTKDMKMDFPHLFACCFYSMNKVYQHETCHQCSKNTLFPLCYIDKKTFYLENYRFVQLKYIFRSEEASGVLVVSTFHCSWKSRRKKHQRGHWYFRALMFPSGTQPALPAHLTQCQHTA